MNTSTRLPRLWLLVLIVSGLSSSLRSAEGTSETSPQQARFFELHVRPLLAEHCLGCHDDQKQKGGLRLDNLAGHLSGGDSGAAIVPGDPDDSLLIEAVRYEGLEMPPAGKLDDESIRILERWVELGAPWPGTDAASLRATVGAGQADRFSDQERQWWAFQPAIQVAVPEVDASRWQPNPIDAFIYDRMRSEGLSPAPPADRQALIRRLTFDLWGLPPTDEQIRRFVNDTAPDAVEALVDQLLDSPQYGERWARHWLDLVRYADSDGYRADGFRSDAYRYRDYVISSLNNDKPYDRFVREQIAGDELFPDDPDALTATGFLRHWIYEYNSRDARTQWDLIMTDITDTTGDVFLGMGMQCARCHNHKFDPILQQDYFRLRAFFEGFLPQDQTVVAGEEQRAAYTQQLAAWEKVAAPILSEIESIEAPYRERARRSAVTKFPQDLQDIANKPVDQRTPHEQQLYYLVERQVLFEYDRMDSRLKKEDKDRVLQLRKQLNELSVKRPDELPMAMTACDVAVDVPETLIPKRGRQPVPPGVLSIIDPEPIAVEALPEHGSSGRRSALARWLTQPDNPLSTRVIVNRVWQYHFGKGLASNASDFGKLGGPPSHPELLDWLTVWFVNEGWSLKSLHRLIVLSETYQQSALHPQIEHFQQIDPSNKFYWRGDVRRLDAEQIRDAVLMVSGKLDSKMSGPGVLPSVPRRTIYTRSMRNARDPLLEVFDLPLFFTSESARNTTTTPVQSLLLINSAEYLQLASLLAKQAGKHGDNIEQQVRYVWQTALGRDMTVDELSAALAFIQHQADRLREGRSDDLQSLVAARIPYRDGQAVAMMDQRATSLPQVEIPRDLHPDAMTVELFCQVRSVYDSGTVRTMLSKWGRGSRQPGWAFGITGKGSRRKPQTLVLHMWGKKRDGTIGEAAVFSDQYVELNTPYYTAAAFQPATADTPGTVTFYLKDLSNEEEPIDVAVVEHDLVGGLENDQPLVIGGRTGGQAGQFDGVLDDIRISADALSQDQLLYFEPTSRVATLAHWKFEADPGVLFDSSDHALHLSLRSPSEDHTTAQQAALIDFCHVVLNSSEFLYVR